MAEIKIPQTHEERVLSIMALYGVERSEAEFILAIEDGIIDGDVVNADLESEEE